MKYEFTKLGEMTKSCEITNCRKLSAISHWASLHSETKGREFFLCVFVLICMVHCCQRDCVDQKEILLKFFVL